MSIGQNSLCRRLRKMKKFASLLKHVRLKLWQKFKTVHSIQDFITALSLIGFGKTQNMGPMRRELLLGGFRLLSITSQLSATINIPVSPAQAPIVLNFLQALSLNNLHFRGLAS